MSSSSSHVQQQPQQPHQQQQQQQRDMATKVTIQRQLSTKDEAVSSSTSARRASSLLASKREQPQQEQAPRRRPRPPDLVANGSAASAAFRGSLLLDWFVQLVDDLLDNHNRSLSKSIQQPPPPPSPQQERPIRRIKRLPLPQQKQPQHGHTSPACCNVQPSSMVLLAMSTERSNECDDERSQRVLNFECNAADEEEDQRRHNETTNENAGCESDELSRAIAESIIGELVAFGALSSVVTSSDKSDTSRDFQVDYFVFSSKHNMNAIIQVLI